MTVEPISPTSGHNEVGAALAARLQAALEAGRSTLWLVCGGSAIIVAVHAAELLRAANIDLRDLTVGLTDERYGAVGFPDSNWRQLSEAGFELPGATLHPTLTGGDLETTTTEQAAWLKGVLEAYDYALALCGIGPDGHIAGMLPGSPAVGSLDYAYGYESDPYTRITMTPPAFARLDEAVVYAVGATKRAPLQHLMTGDIVLDDEPAQVLTTIPLVTVYTDQKELTV